MPKLVQKALTNKVIADALRQAKGMTETRFTPSGVRLRRHSTRPGGLNWLLLPGGPGIGSESATCPP